MGPRCGEGANVWGKTKVVFVEALELTVLARAKKQEIFGLVGTEGPLYAAALLQKPTAEGAQ